MERVARAAAGAARRASSAVRVPEPLLRISRAGSLRPAGRQGALAGLVSSSFPPILIHVESKHLHALVISAACFLPVLCHSTYLD